MPESISNPPAITRALLIPMNGDQPDSDSAHHILVQFNPESLRVSLSNTLKADSTGGSSSGPAQYVDKSESSLTVQLLFDTSIARDDRSGGGDTQQPGVSARHEANSDVRVLTRRIADTFMQPQNPEADRPGPPRRCRFQWGAFQFTGMFSSYSETLDFFSPEGIPLRATLALTLKEDRYQFDQLNVAATQRAQPQLTPGGPELSADRAAQAAGRNPKDWRDIALFNGLENPRLGLEQGLSVPGVSLPTSASFGVGANAGLGASASPGASASIGAEVPGAFVRTGFTRDG